MKEGEELLLCNTGIDTGTGNNIVGGELAHCVSPTNNSILCVDACAM